GFVGSADVGVLSIGNGAGEFPVALVAPGFEPLPSDAERSQARLRFFVTEVGRDRRAGVGHGLALATDGSECRCRRRAHHGLLELGAGSLSADSERGARGVWNS